MTARCVQGDATKDDSWRDALGGEKAQLLFTDPPYCLLTRRKKTGEKRQPKGAKNEGAMVRRFESVREYRKFTDAWLKVALAHLDPTAPMVIWTNLLGKEPIARAALDLGRSPAGEFIWAKRTREGNSGEELLRMVETALVFTSAPLPGRSPYDPAVPWAAVAGYDDDGEAKRFGSHPNHKPFGVLEPLLRTWSKPGDLIVDPFAGSGSIPAAAVRLGRRAAGIELLPEWARRVSDRLAEASA